MRQASIALRPEEELLTGHWVSSGDEIVGDETCNRIEQLVAGVLEKVASDSSGWDTLFQDPSDGRFWELYYPDSGAQGGGPPSIRHLEAKQVESKYNWYTRHETHP